jgi:hypothetical protein
MTSKQKTNQPSRDTKSTDKGSNQQTRDTKFMDKDSTQQGRDSKFMDVDRMVNEGLGSANINEQNELIGDTTTDTMYQPESIDDEA